MKVENILKEKGTDIVHIVPTATLGDAVSILSEKNIGAIIVMNDDRTPLGILSERDIVRRIAKHGNKAVSLAVDGCMTCDLYTCGPEDSVNDIMSQMTQHRIRHMPVVKNDKIVGMISIGDVVKRKIQETEQEAASLRDYIASS